MERENLEMLLSDMFSLTRDDDKLMTILRGAGKKGKEVIRLADWKKECRSYLSRYYKNSNFIFGPSDVDTIIDILSGVCNNNSWEGFLFKDYDIIKHFEFLGYDKKFLEIKFGTALPNGIISYLTYIKQKNVILVSKKNMTGQKDNEYMDNAVFLVKLFISLYCKDLQDTGVTVIGLLIRTEETENETVKCDLCKLLSPSHKVFESLNACQDWLKYFEKFVDLEKPKENNTLLNDIAGEILCFMAVQPLRKALPNLTTKISEQLKQTYLLLTPQQMKLHISDAKHIIIQGSYGTGKSVLGVKKLEHILEDIQKREAHDEKIIYTNFDSKSNLHYQMKKDVMEYIKISSGKIKLISNIFEVSESPNIPVHVYHNSAGKNLSFILQEALAIKNMKGVKIANFHFVVEEYDGETLTHEEAEALTILTNTDFEQSNSIILAQPLIKKRRCIVQKKSYERESYLFHKLKNFKVVELEEAFRYSNEICRITKSTQQLVHNKESIFKKELGKLEFEKQQQHEHNESYLNTSIYETFNDIKGSNSSINSSKSNKMLNQIRDLDQAFEKLTSARRKTRKDRIASKFHFISEPKQGVDINGGIPKLFEFSYDIQSFNDIAARFLAVLLIKFINENEATVLLHLSRKIPEILKKAVQISLKHSQRSFLYTEEIEEYFEAEDSQTKVVFLSSFSSVNGLEFDHVIIFANYSEYYQKQYLPHVISRCTYNLKIVLLPREGIVNKSGFRKILRKFHLKKDKTESKDTVESITMELVHQRLIEKVLVVDCNACEKNQIFFSYNCSEGDNIFFKVHTHSAQYRDIIKLSEKLKMEELDLQWPQLDVQRQAAAV